MLISAMLPNKKAGRSLPCLFINELGAGRWLCPNRWRVTVLSSSVASSATQSGRRWVGSIEEILVCCGNYIPHSWGCCANLAYHFCICLPPHRQSLKEQSAFDAYHTLTRCIILMMHNKSTVQLSCFYLRQRELLQKTLLHSFRCEFPLLALEPQGIQRRQMQ